MALQCSLVIVFSLFPSYNLDMRWHELANSTRENLLGGIPEAELNIPADAEISQVTPLLEAYLRNRPKQIIEQKKRGNLATLAPAFVKGKSGNPKGRPKQTDDGQRLIAALKNNHVTAANKVISKYAPAYSLTEKPNKPFTSGSRAVKSAQEKHPNV